MQLTWKTIPAAIIAAVAGTIVFDLLGVIFGMGWDVPGALAGALETTLAVGVILHYVIGIALAVIFAGLINLFFGPLWLRGVEFGAVQTILGVWLFMMPLMGMGVAGVESPMGFMLGFLSLVRHLVWGAVVGLLYGMLAPRFAGREITEEPGTVRQ